MKIPDSHYERVSVHQLRENLLDVTAELGDELVRQGDADRLESLIALYSLTRAALADLREVSR